MDSASFPAEYAAYQSNPTSIANSSRFPAEYAAYQNSSRNNDESGDVSRRIRGLSTTVSFVE